MIIYFNNYRSRGRVWTMIYACPALYKTRVPTACEVKEVLWLRYTHSRHYIKLVSKQFVKRWNHPHGYQVECDHFSSVWVLMLLNRMHILVILYFIHYTLSICCVTLIWLMMLIWAFAPLCLYLKILTMWIYGQLPYYNFGARVSMSHFLKSECKSMYDTW